MNLRTQVNRTLSIALTGMLALAAVLVMPALAQEYGTGVVVDVPYVAPGTLTMDGNADEADWDNALELNLTENWDGEWSGHPDPDVTVLGRLLYTEDTLFVYVSFEDYELYWDTGQGDQILVGIDPVHEAGVTDTLTTGFDGWPENPPDQGPYAYKVWIGNDTIPAISVNFSTEISPADSGWVNGTVFVDETEPTWGVEMAVYAPQIEQGAQIGFNIGGASGKEEGADDRGEGTYAFFSWQVCDPDQQPTASFCGPGGTVMSDAHSFATLNLVPGTVAIEETPTDEIPTGFTLEQNYPNPFNPATTIEYGLIRPAQVILSVHNTLGQRVATLVDGQRPAGAYSVRWEPENLPSGIYLYQLQVDGNTVASREMMLIK